MQMIEEKAEVIEDYLAKEQYQSYTIEVHAMKSSSRMVGASKLADQFYELELLGKGKELDGNIVFSYNQNSVCFGVIIRTKEGIYMIKSMTGFGRYEVAENNRKFTVEIKSVNHRYLDVNIKMPKKLNYFEAGIRSELKNYIQRGKVDLFITFEDMGENTVCVKYNHDVAAEYMKYLQQMADEFGLDNDIRVSTLSRYPEVLDMEEQSLDEEELWKELKKAIDGACEGFVETRVKEGENLKQDLITKCDGMLELVDFISVRSPRIIADYKQKLEDKVKELLADTQVDENRLLMEVTIFADKVCVDEELVRLRSHIESTKATLTEGGSVGRKLDFIAQEMNREANTILSKANDLEISNCAISLKTEIEKVREQIQNIE